jgi:hypothetical protein
MTLDLQELTDGWDCPPGELRARVIVGRDDDELVQLRVDLGVMQMFGLGRPDGERYRGMPSAREFILHELRVPDNTLSSEDWRELERELTQLNYRRMAFASVAEDALRDNVDEDARRFIRQALADIEACLQCLSLLERVGATPRDYPVLQPTLVFDRARLSAQLDVVEGRFETAIEQADAGAGALDELLVELGYDEEQREDDPALRYLQGLGQQLRREYGITRTLRERLEEALAREDFEAASQIRDELARRESEQTPPETDPPPTA